MEVAPDIVVAPDTPPIRVMGPYLAVLLVIMSILVLADRIIQNKKQSTIVTREFKRFQRSYLNVYLCALGAEWLQDSHLFAVLLRHGHSVIDVAQLFAASFVTSYLFGALSSNLPNGPAQLFGGKKAACTWCFIFYGLAGLTLYQDDFATLMLGRLLYGIGTALLHTVFDAYMGAQHAASAFPDEWLIQTYQEVSRSTTVVSIGSGIVAEIVAMQFGIVSPFLLSSGLCLCGMLLISRSWDSNESNQGVNCAGCASIGSAIGDGISQTMALVHTHERAALCLVIVQAFFEATMYITLFMWTPVLRDSAVEAYGMGTPPPYGLIFSLLMASLMLGSHTFQLTSSSMAPQKMCSAICVVGSVACLALATLGETDHWTGLLALLVFQFCVGIYYPSIGFLRGMYVPFESRNLVAQLSKTILALIVIILLMNLAEMSSLMFLMCAVLLFSAFVLLSFAAQDKREKDAAAAKQSNASDRLVTNL